MHEITISLSIDLFGLFSAKSFFRRLQNFFLRTLETSPVAEKNSQQKEMIKNKWRSFVVDDFFEPELWDEKFWQVGHVFHSDTATGDVKSIWQCSNCTVLVYDMFQAAYTSWYHKSITVLSCLFSFVDTKFFSCRPTRYWIWLSKTF